MHVGRLARIYLTLSGDQRITIPPKELTVGRSRIVLLELKADGRTAEITLAALMRLTERLKLTPDRKPVLSHRMVVDSDVSITRFARAMAVAEWAPLRITSPIPHFTLAPESHRDWEFIRTLESDYVAGDASDPAYAHPSLPAEILLALDDRQAGVGYLSDAVGATDDSIARLVACWKVFENAFASPMRVLSDVLEQFLHPAMGYTSSEIRDWIRARNALIHADRSDATTNEGQRLRKLSYRALQAAFDIVVNKRTWRSASTERVERWFPMLFTVRADGREFVSRTQRFNVRFHHYDPFGRFPVDLTSSCGLPAGWWPDNDRRRALAAAGEEPGHTSRFFFRWDGEDAQPGEPMPAHD